jgi:hypothetical protein
MPFTLGLSSRTRVRIDRPEAAKVSSDGNCLYVTDSNGLESVISIRHVATISFDPPAPEPDAVVGG